VPTTSLTAVRIDKTRPSDFPNQTVQFPQLRAGVFGSCSFCVVSTKAKQKQIHELPWRAAHTLDTVRWWKPKQSEGATVGEKISPTAAFTTTRVATRVGGLLQLMKGVEGGEAQLKTTETEATTGDGVAAAERLAIWRRKGFSESPIWTRGRRG
jgi:hypothetical protein